MNSNGTSPLNRHTHTNDLAREGQRIQELAEKLDEARDPVARQLLQELLETTLSFYGHGLERILEVVAQAEAGGGKVCDALVRDEGVRGLLLIHGLHPVPLAERLNEALAKVRPYMESHGGNVELLGLENDFARLRLQGHCKTCPSSSVTLELAVRAAIDEACPDLAGFEVEGMPRAAANGNGYEHTPAAAPEWTRLESAEEIAPGAFRSLRVENESLFVCNVEGQLYAYRDQCPACNLPLHLGALDGATIVCSLGHRFDARHAGQGADRSRGREAVDAVAEGPRSHERGYEEAATLARSGQRGDELHLEPVPLLMKDGVVRVAVGRTLSERRSDVESLHHEHTN